MTAILAILCPGQGGQRPAMFDLARTDPQAAALLDRCLEQAGLDRPLDAVLADRQLLFSNKLAQPLIVAMELAMWEAIRNHIPEPALVAGYSIGELAAYAVAGSLNAQDAVGLAAARARLMDDCLQQSPAQILAAVAGVNAASVAQVLREHRFYIAIETGEENFIVGGLQDAWPEAEAVLVRRGARITVLPVEVASHTPYMATAVQAFEDALRLRPFAAPRMPVLAGISAARIHRPDDAISTLSRQIAETIRWTDCMDACAEAGVTIALELGQCSALSRMLQTRHPQIECRSVSDFRSLQGVRTWLASRID